MTPRQRGIVAGAIADYIRADILRYHRSIPQAHQQGNGRAFLDLHRGMIRHLEQYLWSRGMPLPVWYPGNPIPPEFAGVKLMGNIPIPALRPLAQIPPMRAPQHLQPNALRQYRTARDLGNAIMPWHDNVHQAAGGTMAQTEIAPASILFWAWHGFVDEMYVHWERTRGDA